METEYTPACNGTIVLSYKTWDDRRVTHTIDGVEVTYPSYQECSRVADAFNDTDYIQGNMDRDWRPCCKKDGTV
jgi:hypothetical protein